MKNRIVSIMIAFAVVIAMSALQSCGKSDAAAAKFTIVGAGQ